MMENLKYGRLTILEKLIDNRKKHKEIYEEAVEGFKEEVVKELEENLALAKAGKEYRLHLKQVQPTHHMHDYNRAISMLELSTQDQITLTQQEFSQYVLDNWNWSENFRNTSFGYAKSFKG